MERRRDYLHPASPGTPQISEDDSDEGPLHEIIAEESQRHAARILERADSSESQKSEDDGALGLTRGGQDD